MTLRNSLLFLMLLSLFTLGCSSWIGVGGTASENVTPESSNDPRTNPLDPIEGLPRGSTPPTDFVAEPPEILHEIYIDPDAASNGDGTQANPYNSWFNIPTLDGEGCPDLQSDTGYFMMAGSFEELTSGCEINIGRWDARQNVWVGTYGGTQRAHLKASFIRGYGVVFVKFAHDVLVQNLHLESGEDGGSGMRIDGHYLYTHSIVADNLELDRGGFTAVHSPYNDKTKPDEYNSNYYWDDLTLMNSYVHDIGGDGIFVQSINDTKILNNIVLRANNNWYLGCSNANCPGDGIQFGGSDNARVAYNYVDRSDTANKFCIIINREYDQLDRITALVEYNTCIGPKLGGGGAGLFFADHQDTIVRYNTITAAPEEGAYEAIDVHLGEDHPSYGMEFYGNIISHRYSIGRVGYGAKVFNNVMYDISPHANGDVWFVDTSDAEMRNNIFDNRANLNGGYTHVGGSVISNNLFWVNDGVSGDNPVVGPAQFADPENGDFSLLSSSPAIDAGTMTGLPHETTVDMFGTSIPQNGIPDIGAIESD